MQHHTAIPSQGEEVPFFTVGPFASTDTLFPDTAGDLDLFTDEEVIALTNAGVLEIYNHWYIHSSIAITCSPGWSQTHLPGNKATGILRATGIL